MEQRTSTARIRARREPWWSRLLKRRGRRDRLPASPGAHDRSPRATITLRISPSRHEGLMHGFDELLAIADRIDNMAGALRLRVQRQRAAFLLARRDAERRLRGGHHAR